MLERPQLLERFDPLEGCLGQIRKRQEGEAKNVMLGAFAGHYDIKHVVVVDEDVDIHDPAEVEWAQSFRVKPSEDVFVVDRTATAPLDPYTNGSYSSSVGIDATKPFGEVFPDVSEVPDWKDFPVPELDGLTATALLRTREREEGLPRTPVIMLTANALDEHIKASFEAGADMHLSKPIRPDTLIEAIMHAMAGGAAQQDADEAAA